jgi:hypothetical protein
MELRLKNKTEIFTFDVIKKMTNPHEKLIKIRQEVSVQMVNLTT